MAFDAVLAERIRDGFSRRLGIVEKRMFGGVVFQSGGNIVVGVWQDSLIVRLGDSALTALQEPGVREFDITGRAMKGWVLVDPLVLGSDQVLQSWLDRAYDFVKTLPVKR